MGPTLFRYFLVRYAVITLWFFLGVFLLVFLVDFTEMMRRIGDAEGVTVGAVAAVSAMRVPMIMLQTVPFVGLFSAIATLVSLNRKYELVVARAAGISAWQFLMPACIGALLFGAASIMLLNPLAAFGLMKSEVLENELRSGTSTQNRAPGVPWLRQVTAEEGETIIGARAVLGGGRELAQPVFLSLDADGDIVQRRDAESAVLHEGYWELTNVRRFIGGNPAPPLASERVPTALQPEYVLDRLGRPEAVPFYELPSRVEVARSLGLRASAFAMQLHSLVAMPMLLVAMTLIAAVVSMRFARMGQSATLILGGIVAGFLLYVVSVLVKAFGNAGFVPPLIAAWVPVVVAMFFGVTFLLYREDG
ncbi:MAG: LPS export ABC transporter permease LptG [Mesorhizobium amorphae]|nr:MAG: LPS export ABC transporter permease LptG [Mesorhizobium amorphae]